MARSFRNLRALRRRQQFLPVAWMRPERRFFASSASRAGGVRRDRARRAWRERGRGQIGTLAAVPYQLMPSVQGIGSEE